MTVPAPTSTSAVVRARVRERLDDLTEPQVSTTVRWVPGEPGGPLVRQEARVRLPGLLVQLAQGVAGSTAGQGSSGTKARPPGSLAGVDTLRAISLEAKLIAARVLGRMAADVTPGLQVVVRPRRLGDALAVIRRYLDDVDREQLLDIDAAVRRWWSHARIVTTWDRPPLRPHVPCPACRKRGDLRVVDQPLTMVCLGCGAAWDASTVAELEAVYRLAFADPIPDPPVESLHEERASA
ncbi:hypothetical protein GCM10023113_27710 [Cellulomonas oligotrophica]|nr:hypothetical protein Col01nite_21660 [Cellulomonas oligotrophica]